MKFVLAPDSFKESMSAKEACEAMKEGILAYHDYDICLCPMADGGEGTLETLVYGMNGRKETVTIHGPLFEKREASIGYVNDVAIIECAQACGLELLSEQQKDPYQTSTYGLGELMNSAMDHGVKTMMICLGGSATNDGGMGMMRALGVRFFDKDHQEVAFTMRGLKDVDSIDVSKMDQRIFDIEIIGVCDVNNPLCGENGATYVYAPQKGLPLSQREEGDQSMKHYASLVDALLGDYQNQPGAGAAGGLGYALLAFCKAKLRPGFEVVSEVMGLEEKIKECDKVFVGEGKIDRQTQFGKTPYGVLKIAQKYHKDVYAFAGKVEDSSILKQLGFIHVYPLTQKKLPLEMALKQGKQHLKQCVYEHMEEIISGI